LLSPTDAKQEERDFPQTEPSTTLWLGTNASGLQYPENISNRSQSTSRFIKLIYGTSCYTSNGLAVTSVGDSKGLLPLGRRSGISKNCVKKTVRENGSKLLSEERSDEFNGRSVLEKVFSYFVEAGEFFLSFASLRRAPMQPRRSIFVGWFCFFLRPKRNEHPVVVTTKKKRSKRTKIS
jgi:hypothetical protein